ncbi:MAG: uridine phosphorylase [Rhodobacteraceae bacterium]|nr:MAG: uridine phosphorylase [Paracoccaceae bacterium]
MTSPVDPPILTDKYPRDQSVFRPENLLREGRRQRGLTQGKVPDVCLLDPDGDIVRWLRASGRAQRCGVWACYHTDLFTFTHEGREIGVIGNAVGASFAVLLAEQLFASGCQLLISITSAGQIAETIPSPCFVLIDKALRDEGTSYHYLAPSDFAPAPAPVLARLKGAFDALPFSVVKGAAWTTDAPYRETEKAIAANRDRGILAVEMEAAALYAFAAARGKSVVCFAHITNQMAQSGDDFEKGEADGALTSLAVVRAVSDALATQE